MVSVDNVKWDEETDYLFLRNNVPNMAKLRGVPSIVTDILQLTGKLDCSQIKAEEGRPSLRLWLPVAECHRGDEPERRRSPVDLSETLIFIC